MTRSHKVLGLIVCISSALGCSSDSGGRTVSNPCLRKELAACGQVCDDVSKSCGVGLYCGDDAKCAAECTPESAKTDCTDGKGCSADGHCVVGGASGGENTGGGNTSGVVVADGGNGGVCGQVKLDATPKTPNVIVIVDQSSSMDDKFDDNGTRWEVLKASLLADDGLFAELQALVRFGIVLYSGEDDGNACPNLSQVAVAINNLEAIRALYQPQDTLNDTPTGDAINAVLDQIENTDLVGGDNPTIFVLATDGEPDTCAEPNPQNGQEESVASVKRAFSLDIRTYVIAVAQEDELSEGHLNDMANAGIGVMSGAPSFRVDNDAALRAALRGVVGGELSCTVPLKGKVTAKDPCAGTVLLDGKELECKGANGWELVNPKTIEIKGTACDALKTGKKLEANFDCGDAIPDVI